MRALPILPCGVGCVVRGRVGHVSEGRIQAFQAQRACTRYNKFESRCERGRCGFRGENDLEGHFVDSLRLGVLVAQSSNGLRNARVKGKEEPGQSMDRTPGWSSQVVQFT